MSLPLPLPNSTHVKSTHYFDFKPSKYVQFTISTAQRSYIDLPQRIWSRFFQQRKVSQVRVFRPVPTQFNLLIHNPQNPKPIHYQGILNPPRHNSRPRNAEDLETPCSQLRGAESRCTPRPAARPYDSTPTNRAPYICLGAAVGRDPRSRAEPETPSQHLQLRSQL